MAKFNIKVHFVEAPEWVVKTFKAKFDALLREELQKQADEQQINEKTNYK